MSRTETQTNGAKTMTQTSLFSKAPRKSTRKAKAAAPKASAWKIEIEIEFSENPEIGEFVGQTWDSFEAFTAMIAANNHNAPADGCYNKTYVEIPHLTSGERYDMRLDVTHPTARDTSDNDLLERVRSMCAYMLGNLDDGDKRAEWKKWADRFELAAWQPGAQESRP
jgi:hypothetical protein